MNSITSGSILRGGGAVAHTEAVLNAESLLMPWSHRREMAICYDKRGTLCAVNTAFARKFGMGSVQLLGTKVEQFIHPEDLSSWKVGTDQILSDFRPMAREHRWKSVQGWRWLAWEESVVFDRNQPESDEEFLVISIGRDVTRRRLAEEHFSKLAQAVEQSPVAIIMTTPDEVVQYVNSTYTELSGYTLEDIYDKEISVLREGHPSAESYQEFRETVARGEPWRGELSTRCKDGTLLWEQVQVSPIRGLRGEIKHLLCLREDITVRKNLEEQLRQAQKMESLGTLASGIAHDFNNILAIIRGYSELLQLRGGMSDASKSKLRKILDATGRACDLIRRILTFSRKADVSFRPVKVNSVIEELARLMRETLPRNISIDLDLDASIPLIMADSPQIQQVVMNLCVNARDAMLEGGSLEVVTSMVPGSELKHLNLDHSCAYVCIRVSDTGYGMAPELADRIFEPFFTTKTKSGGTGLGLSVVYGIVSNHFGSIEVKSQPGEGSSFFVYLPVNEVSEVVGSLDGEAVFPEGSERVLIVDDEHAIRDLLTIAFRTHGYSVDAVADGRAALERLDDPYFDADAVILDLDLPHVNGINVLQGLRQKYAELPVVIITGNLPHKTRELIEGMSNVSYILKPFHLSDVGARIREVMSSVSKSREANG